MPKPRVLICDLGLNIELAISFAHAGYNTAYCFPIFDAFPTAVQRSIGSGFDEFEKIDDLDDALDFADLVVCPDTYSKQIVGLCRRIGIPVFGAGEAEQFENDRSFCKHMLERLGLPVGPYVELMGLEALEKYLRANDDKYVKLDGHYRGVQETFHHVKWRDTVREYWAALITGLGSSSEIAEFIVEMPIKSKCEVGRDTLTCIGKYPQLGLVGYEEKAKSYLGFVCKNPPLLEAVDSKVATYFAQTGAKTFWSDELRYTADGIGHLIDPTVRTAHPVIEGQLEVFKNIPKVVEVITTKNHIDPLEKVASYVAIIQVKSAGLADNYAKVSFPKDMRRFVKVRNARMDKGELWVVPKSSVACSVVGIGDSPRHAIDKANELAQEVEVDLKYYDANALDKLLEESVPAGEKLGIPFS